MNESDSEGSGLTMWD